VDEHNITEDIGALKEASRRQEKATDKLFDILDELVPTVRILAEKIEQIPSSGQIKTYAAFGGGAAVVISFVGVIIYRAITSAP